MIEKLECTCIEAYKTRKMRDPNCCACSCDHNDLVEQLAKANETIAALSLDTDNAVTLQAERNQLKRDLAKANERVKELEWTLGNLDDYLSNKNKFAIEKKIEAVNKVLGSERFELENRPFDFGVRVESIEIILKNLEIELNSEQLRKEQE